LSQTAAILDADGFRLSPSEKAFFRESDPFGFILFARNIATPDQVRALCGDFREAVGREAMITIDQEGGRVQRLRAPLGREWLSPLDHVTRAGDNAARAMYLRYRLIAAELRDLGIDSNCAPMADVLRSDTHPFLKNRCYGDDPQLVAMLARAVADGMLAGGVLPVVKHMPGHGRSVQDSHKNLPHVTASRADLDASDFAAFAALADLPLGMTAHLVYDVIDDTPATISPAMIALIRDRIGFDGLLMTDDISMKALRGTPAERARAAIAAGCDLALFCNASLGERVAVAEAAGPMSAAAQRRADAALTQRGAPDDLDIPAAEAELATLMRGQVYGG